MSAAAVEGARLPALSESSGGSSHAWQRRPRAHASRAEREPAGGRGGAGSALLSGGERGGSLLGGVAKRGARPIASSWSCGCGGARSLAGLARLDFACG